MGRIGELEKLILLAEGATPGPWEWKFGVRRSTFEATFNEEGHLQITTGYGWDNDGEFIVAARSSLPKLAEQMRGVLQIHQPAWDEPRLCKTCSTRWPCDEARICGVNE